MNYVFLMQKPLFCSEPLSVTQNNHASILRTESRISLYSLSTRVYVVTLKRKKKKKKEEELKGSHFRIQK